MEKGLTNKQVIERQKQYGYNEIPTVKSKNFFGIALKVMKEPMFILLICCGTLYILLGNVNEGLVLLSTIIIIIFVTFYQYQKAEKALHELKKLAAPKSTVVRDGLKQNIAFREIVPDDIVIIHEGDRIPADGILQTDGIVTIDESVLTGESVAVVKSNTNSENEVNALVYSGTMLLQGSAEYLVRQTGESTVLGKIGLSLKLVPKQQSRMQKEMKVLVRNLFIIGICISIFVVFVFYLKTNNFMQSLLIGLAASMSILPEEFPVVLTIFMALGAWRMSKKNVLTNEPAAIEGIGLASILCSDKTGTITQNRMEVVSIYNLKSEFPKATFAKNKKGIEEIIEIAFLASKVNSIDPMEKAFILVNEKINSPTDTKNSLLKEYPLTKDILAMTRVLKSTTDDRIIAYAKGAPEAIFSLCTLHKAAVKKYSNVVEGYAAKGYRILAVATAVCKSSALPESQNEFDFVFRGLICLADPIRPEVKQAILECKDAGVKVIMITGDYPTTAKSIAVQIGMNPKGIVMTGNELDSLDDEQLKQKINDVNVFARVVPEQKLRIVKALQANNEVVIMTGDGVNDAPALKAANIGIAMGNSGTDVAREASAMVLLDDNFASIVVAIKMGRKIFDNLQKAMTYIMAIHIPIIGLTLLPAFVTSLPILLLPLHIVVLELIIDPACTIAYENEPDEIGIMNRPPANATEKFFGTGKILKSVFEGLLLFASTLFVYFYAVQERHAIEDVRSISFASLVMGNVFLILTNLSKSKNVFQVIVEKNWAVWIILIATSCLLYLLIAVPYLRNIFKFGNPAIIHFVPSFAGAFSVLLILEIVKFIKNKSIPKTNARKT